MLAKKVKLCGTKLIQCLRRSLCAASLLDPLLLSNWIITLHLSLLKSIKVVSWIYSPNSGYRKKPKNSKTYITIKNISLSVHSTFTASSGTFRACNIFQSTPFELAYLILTPTSTPTLDHFIKITEFARFRGAVAPGFGYGVTDVSFMPVAGWHYTIHWLWPIVLHKTEMIRFTITPLYKLNSF